MFVTGLSTLAPVRFLAVVLFLISDIRIFAYMEGMDAVVSALVATAVVDSAACHNPYIYYPST